MTSSTFLVAIGSNRRGRHGAPRAEVRAAIVCLGDVTAQSRIVETAPLGPSIRRFANAAVVVETREAPPVLLARLKAIERDFGRRRGERWGARVIDLDIVLWSGGCWRGGRRGRALSVPHPGFRARAFVLGPALEVAARWHDPVSGFTLRQLAARLAKVDRAAVRP